MRSIVTKVFWSLLFAALLPGISMAQSAKEKRANKLYDEFAFVKAIEVYEEIVKEGEANEQVIKHLANSYRMLNEWAKSEPWYAQVVESSIVENIDNYYYAQALKANQRYEESAKWMAKYAQLSDDDTRPKEELKNKSQLAELLTGSEYITLSTLSANSSNSDFGGTYLNDTTLIFASARETDDPVRITFAWTDQPFLDLYAATITSTGELTQVREWAPELNTKYHESSLSFNPSHQVLYFTRSNYVDKKVRKSKKDINNLKIFEARLLGTSWSSDASLHFNSDEYSCGHPSLTSDGQKMYFASDMPGGIGGTDIYVVEREGGKWGTPRNLGRPINTEGEEMFPFIHEDGTLYYSSDGLYGLGGLDIFMAAPAADSISFEAPMNLASPINSPYDDFAFVISNDKSQGYLSSNKPNGKGDDDIYHFRLEFPILENIIEPILADEPLQEPIEEPVTASVDSIKPLEEMTVNDVTEGQVIKLENIYYDLDKSNIRKDAAVELNKLIKFLQNNPTVFIELSAHTDCRAPAKYNQALSQRRALSAMTYIVEKGGIDMARITARGYGESRLINECADGVSCSEEKHQANRRTEIKILKK